VEIMMPFTARELDPLNQFTDADLATDTRFLHSRVNQARADREALRKELLSHIDAHIEAGKAHQREATQAMEALKELGLARLSDAEKYPSLRRVLQPESAGKPEPQPTPEMKFYPPLNRPEREFLKMCAFVVAGIVLVGVGLLLGG
jgi:hypothetical protein